MALRMWPQQFHSHKAASPESVAHNLVRPPSYLATCLACLAEYLTTIADYFWMVLATTECRTIGGGVWCAGGGGAFETFGVHHMVK